MGSKPEFMPENEPFGQGRSAFRLLFDFAIMLSCFHDALENKQILDFGTGTAWIAEWLNRMGYEVTAFDNNKDLTRIGRMRVACDKRVNQNLIHFRIGDGHQMPFSSEVFGHICCFDSLHHMNNYPQVLSEFYRILIQGGRAIFVEPGAAHSTSKQTINFIEKYKKGDPTWIERDVVLEEIYEISQGCGFSQMKIRPSIFPNLCEYDFYTWRKFLKGNPILENEYLNLLKSFNYQSRVVFYLDKGSLVSSIHSDKSAQSRVKKMVKILFWRIIDLWRTIPRKFLYQSS